MDFSRADRLQSQMLRELAGIIMDDLKDRPTVMITFTRTEISRDLKHAKIYFSVLGDDKQRDTGMEFLKRHAKVIRKALSSRMRIRYCPELYFKFDDSTGNVLRINELLDQIKKDEDND